jgi:hypothetical protein
LRDHVCEGSAQRQAKSVALFGAENRDGWGVGLTILTALANLLLVLPGEEACLALFHGARRVAVDCDRQAPRLERAPLGSQPDPATIKRWLRRWTKVRHREAARRPRVIENTSEFRSAFGPTSFSAGKGRAKRSMRALLTQAMVFTAKARQLFSVGACRPVNALASIPLGLPHPSGNRLCGRLELRSTICRRNSGG